MPTMPLNALTREAAGVKINSAVELSISLDSPPGIWPAGRDPDRRARRFREKGQKAAADKNERPAHPVHGDGRIWRQKSDRIRQPPESPATRDISRDREPVIEER